MQRNNETSFREYYPWFFKDWFVSGARSRLTVPQRAIYLDLLGLCYVEGGIPDDPAVLLGRLGIGREYQADLETAMKEFEIEDGRLTHPRVSLEIDKLAAARIRRVNGAKARWAKEKPTPEVKKAKVQPDDEWN